MRNHITPEQYLELDRKAEFKSEYWTGELEPVEPLAWVHSVVVSNLVRELSLALRDRADAVCVSGVRLLAGSAVLAPDAVVVCGAPEFTKESPAVLTNPKIVCEVSTPETAVADGDRKVDMYGSIASVREYVWITVDRIDARVFTKRAEREWLMELKSELKDSVLLRSLDIGLRLADLYNKVEFSDANVGVGYMRPLES